MNSRDRLRSGELCRELEQELEDLLKNHPGLRALHERRRREETHSRFQDSKPLKQILEMLLNKSRPLRIYFYSGNTFQIHSSKLTPPQKTNRLTEKRIRHFSSSRERITAMF